MSSYTNNLFVPNSENNSWAHLYAFVTPNSRVLDVGCSSGHFSEVLINEKQCEVIGIDIDVEDIQLAQEKLTDAHVRNIEKDSIQDLGTFDFIIFADVLEHLADPRAALSEIKKSLKPHGKVLFSIPNMSHISIRLNLLKGFFEYTETGLLDRTHLHYYDTVEVENMFESAGFAIDSMNPTMYEYPESVMKQNLAKVGLTASHTFYDYLQSSQAGVFQFIGSAVVRKSGSAHKKRIAYKFPHDELKEVIVAKEAQVRALEAEIAAIKSSKKWRLVTGVARAKARAVKLVRK